MGVAVNTAVACITQVLLRLAARCALSSVLQIHLVAPSAVAKHQNISFCSRQTNTPAPHTNSCNSQPAQETTEATALVPAATCKDTHSGKGIAQTERRLTYPMQTLPSRHTHWCATAAFQCKVCNKHAGPHSLLCSRPRSKGWCGRKQVATGPGSGVRRARRMPVCCCANLAETQLRLCMKGAAAADAQTNRNTTFCRTTASAQSPKT